MKNPVKEFFHRGLVFGGFGPIITAIIIYIVSLSGEAVSLSAGGLLLAVVSTYLLAFVHAGSTVFNQIENWPVMKSMLWQFLTLYVAYVTCYLLNAWIPFDFSFIIVFTAIFIATYFAIWLIVFLSVKNLKSKMNKQL